MQTHQITEKRALNTNRNTAHPLYYYPAIALFMAPPDGTDKRTHHIHQNFQGQQESTQTEQ